jgi:hypothetical protein
MTLGGIVILLLLVVSLIIFIYLIVISARGWGVLHTLLLCFLFIECWVFMIFSAGVLHRRVGWLEQAAKLETKAVKAEEETQKLTWGNFDVTPELPNAVVPLQGELRRLTADRGRVWRRLDLVSADAGVYKLEMSTAAPAAQDLAAADPAVPAAPAAPAADATQSLPANLVVYGFAEEMNEENQALPSYYLGEFKVTASQAGQVSLNPTLPLEAAQIDLVKNGGAQTWALYELLPLDSHTAFAAPGSQPADDAIYGRMDEAMLTKLLEDIPDDRREKVLRDYLRDGSRADDSDPPPSRWVSVKLLKDYTIDVDSEQDAIATELGFFDKSGRSIDVRLKRTDEGGVKLTPELNKRIVLKSEAAEKLIADGIAELIEPVFVRPLIDYQEAFNRSYVRRHEVRERIALYLRESAELTKANQAGQEMISFRQIENQQLASDLGNYGKEVDVLNKESVLAEEQLTSAKNSLSDVYRQIQSRSLPAPR